MNKLLISIIVMLSLTGCDTFQKKPEIVTRTVTEYVFIDIPKEFTDKPEVPKPISKVDYLKLTHEQREYELVIYSNALMRELALRDLNTDKLLEWNNNQKNIFNQSKKKE